MSSAHWRETCRIKSFTIPFDAENYRSSIAVIFAPKEGWQSESEVYDCVGALMHNGWPVKAKYVRRSKAT